LLRSETLLPIMIEHNLPLRPIGENDYSVMHEPSAASASRALAADLVVDCRRDHSGGPFGDAKTIDDAKARFKTAWSSFRGKVGSEALAKAYAEMNHPNRADRYRR
jgi:hypothetical protein